MKPSSISRITNKLFIALALLGILAANARAFPRYQAPRYESLSANNRPFYENGIYDASVPVPTKCISRTAGAKPMRIRDIHDYFTALAAVSPRVEMFEYGRTHENRPLVYLAITSEENMARLNEIKADVFSLANPSAPYRNAKTTEIINNSPAVAWMAYSIHGDEISGADAAVELAYQLAAGKDERTLMLLDSLVIIIDPSENPDGRERYLSMLTSHATSIPSTDAQALQHSGFWPWGRGNHYLFDLNRDWILLEHPETQGKVRAILEWSPQMLVDAHEMGANSSYLFNPPREPLNFNIPDTLFSWWSVYSADHATAFDRYGWSYYTKEWHEEWYPGYGSAWALYIGAVGLLYEQAGADGSPVKQRDGYILSYREAVHHQFISSIANLETTARNRRALLGSFYQTKINAIEAGKSQTPRRFVIPTDKYPNRANRLAEVLLGLGAEVKQTTSAGTLASAKNTFGETVKNISIPAGSYIVELSQPLRPLIKAAMEFDPHLPKDFLEDERREAEKWSGSKLYEFSSWSLSLAYDCGILATNSAVTSRTKVITEVSQPEGDVINADPKYGWVIDYKSDKAPILAIKLLESGFKVQSSERPFRVDGREFSAGSLLIRRKYNDRSVSFHIAKYAKQLGLKIYGVNTAIVQTGSDLGADSFHNLEFPRIGIFGGPGVSFTDYGSLWHHMDRELEVSHSILNLSNLGFLDLERYNVLILPSVRGSVGTVKQIIGEGGAKKLKGWVKDGGTLICVGTSAAWAADSASEMSSVRLRRNSLEKLDEFAEDNAFELFQREPTVDTNQLWHYKAPEKSDDEKKDNGKPDLEALKREDKRARDLFKPRGVVFNTKLDNENWPAFGCETRVGAGLYTSYAFLSKAPVETIARIEDAENCRIGGLLWPEARERWANTAYMTREGMGRGQIILFAGGPDFRGYWKGTARLFTNCLALGPGFGTKVSVGW
ncbi:MAG: hypothetical protein IIB00_02920 [candidate division Zixibacteria bacterium]|nr:hypothetical protein [candidate division Zixibacteria bacterium]